MPSKQDVAKSNISPVLFLSVDGEPMSFFLRPGPVKRDLQPLITAGGGMMCRVQQPGAILLIKPEERGLINEATAHWYVSTQYIYDCIEKDEQLDLESYRLHPVVIPKKKSPQLSGGRITYTAEEDAAILKFVSEHKSLSVGGNQLWKEMEKQKVTGHSWQSMKFRYKAQLAKKQAEVTKEKTTEEKMEEVEDETKVEENQETDVEKPSSEEDAVSLQKHSTESDQTQIEPQSALADSKQYDEDTQTSTDPQEEAMPVSPQTEEQPAKSIQTQTAEEETPNSLKLEECALDSQADFHLSLAESMEPEREEQQTITILRKESVPENSPAAHSLSLNNTSSQKKIKEKQEASPEQEQPKRRRTRRQLQLEEPEPYGKKLRSSSTSATSSPQPLRKIKPAVKSAVRRETPAEQPSSKKARGTSAAEEQEIHQEESEPADVQESAQTGVSTDTIGETAQPSVNTDNVRETTQADTESDSAPQKAENKKEKKKLGILEAAAKEFEEESESDEDEPPQHKNQAETTKSPPTVTDPAEDAASAQSDTESCPGVQEAVPEIQAHTSNDIQETVCPQAAAPQAVSATCKPHLFIFDSESQEEDSQSLVGEVTVIPLNPLQAVNNNAPYSLTQAQLEEDKQRITELMNQTNQDLVTVTKALLRTSGDFSAALGLLSNPGSFSGPFWDRHDDNLLLSADPEVRQQLQEKYGEEALVKRILFLEVDG